jgi:ABC-type bacteriocin/lantibiotic exporter with double-glycine peptidase domain
MKKTLFIIGGLAILGVGGYFAYKHFNKATKEQFDKLVSTAKSVGADTFEGVDDVRMAKLQDDFVKKLSKKEAETLIATMGVKEADWSPSQKKEFMDIFSKWYGKRIVS